MEFLTLPPEINSLRMYSGPGATSLFGAAAAWSAAGADLGTIAASWGTTISVLSSTWTGPSSLLMVGAAALHQSWLAETAIACETTAAQVMAAAVGYEAAYAATVHPGLIAANRALLMALIATNFLGINTPAIMATEMHYLEMWAQDIAAMIGYHGVAAQAMAVPAFSSVPHLLQSLFGPGSNQTTTGLAGLINLLSGSSNSTVGSAVNSSSINGLVSGGSQLPSQAVGAFTSLLGGLAGGDAGSRAANQNNGNEAPGNISSGGGGIGVPFGAPGTLPAASPTHGPVAATMGRAVPVGGLSVPNKWNVPAAAVASPISGEAGSPGTMGVPGVPLGGGGRSAALGSIAPPRYGTRHNVVARPYSGG